MSYQTSYVSVIGGTGAQGIPVIRGLVEDRRYKVRALTRDMNSQRAKALVELGNVDLVQGTFASEEDLRKLFRGCDGAFVNVDGFNCGEKTETYWTIRAYELALEEGVKFFVYGNLDYGYKKSGYDPKFRCGHYDGKGRMAEWILAQNQDNQKRMGASIFTTGPYIEMAVADFTPFTPKVEDGTVTWRVPLGDGAVVHVALDDCAHYVRWIFDNTQRSNGMDLEVAVDHIHYADLAVAFQKVTGHPAQYIDTDLESFWKISSLSAAADMGAGYNSDPNDPAFMNIRENFTGFLNMWKHSGGNKGVIQRDYKLLDEIHPNRIKSAEEFFRKEDAKGRALGLGGLWDRVQEENIKPTLKVAEDGLKGSL